MPCRKRCFISNLSFKTSWQDLKDKFREVGNVVYANVTRDENGKTSWHFPCPYADPAPHQATALPLVFVILSSLTYACAGKSRGWGIVEYETPEEVTFSPAFPCCGQYIETCLGCDAMPTFDRSCNACLICEGLPPEVQNEDPSTPSSCLTHALCCA